MKLLLFLLSLMPFLLCSQSLDWSLNKGDVAISLVSTDSSSNIITIGRFTGLKDLDPGIGVHNLHAQLGGNYDLYIQKLDENGNFIWAHSFGMGSWSGGAEVIASLEIDSQNNLYLFGHSGDGPWDIDIGSGVSYIHQDEAFVAKLDSNANLIWLRKAYGSGTEISKNMYLDKSEANLYGIMQSKSDSVNLDFHTSNSYVTPNNIVGFNTYYIFKMDTSGTHLWSKKINGVNIINDIGIGSDFIVSVGMFEDTIYIDNPPDSLITQTHYGAAFVCKLDTAGNFIWIGDNYGSDFHSFESIKINSTNQIYVQGVFKDTLNIGLNSPGNIEITANNSGYSTFLIKYDDLGNFINANQWTDDLGSSNLRFNNFFIDKWDELYQFGSYSGEFDADPGLGTVLLPDNGGNGFYQKLNKNGELIYSHSLKNIGTSGISSMFKNNSNGMFLSGGFNGSCDVSPLPGLQLINTTFQQNFLVKLKDSCSQLTIGIESMNHINCYNDGDANVAVNNAIGEVNYLWNNSTSSTDSVAYFTQPGLFTVEVSDSSGCSRSSGVYIDGPTEFSGFDVGVNLITSSFRPGFSSNVWIDAYNNGCDTISGSIIMIKDSLLDFVSSTGLPVIMTGDTITWNYTGLDAYNEIISSLTFNVSTSAVIGDSICFDVSILPSANDIDTSNNNNHYCFPVINGYDPNDIKVVPDGVCAPRYVQDSNMLTYTVRFQNTGNSEAINIVVEDSISPYLDLNSFELVGQSHPNLIVEVNSSRVLSFVFDSIELPAASFDEIGSHGFVVYRLSSLNAGASIGNLINNKAEIYFDFNPAVITNSVQTTFIDLVPEPDSVVDFVSTCQSSYAWVNGETYQNDIDSVYLTFLNEFGCDSVVELKLTFLVLTGDLNENCIIDSLEILGDIDGNGVIDSLELVGDINGNGVIDSTEVLGDANNNGIGNDCDDLSRQGLPTIPLIEIEQGQLIVSNLINEWSYEWIYEWINCDNNFSIISNQIDSTYFPVNNGNFAVIVSRLNCLDTSECLFYGAAGQGEITNEIVYVYPNPSYGVFNIHLANNSSFNYSLYDISGKLLLSNESNNVLDLRSFQNGVYYINVIINSRREVLKIVKL